MLILFTVKWTHVKFKGQMDVQVIRTQFVFQITAVVAISTGTLITKLLIVKMMNELKNNFKFYKLNFYLLIIMEFQ